MRQLKEYPHLTAREGTGDYAVYISVPAKAAAAISKALVVEKAATSKSIAWLVRQRIIEPHAENEARRRNALALDFLDKFSSVAPWTPDSDTLRDDLRKALTGCPTDTNTVFTGRSEEYEERYGDEN